MPHDTPATNPADLERLLAERTVRNAGARALFLAAVRELGRDVAPYPVGRLESLIKVDEHFHALLHYDQLEFLRGPEVPDEADRDFAHTVQRLSLIHISEPTRPY